MNLYIGIPVLVLMTIFISVMIYLCVKDSCNFTFHKSDTEDASL